MDGVLVAAASALWLGILTSISPCPLATNIAAISFIGRRVGNSRQVFLSGLLYTVGRVVAYLAIGMLIVAAVMSVSEVSMWLQRNMNKFLGPILVVVGLVLVGVIRLPVSGGGVGEKLQKRVESMGIWGAGLLGFVFALSFCPVSAALFFGSLIPLAVRESSTVTLPVVYGIGTGLPVFAFALLIAFGTKWVGTMFNKLTLFELWSRRITGLIFIGIGLYFCLEYLFEVI